MTTPPFQQNRQPNALTYLKVKAYQFFCDGWSVPTRDDELLGIPLVALAVTVDDDENDTDEDVPIPEVVGAAACAHDRIYQSRTRVKSLAEQAASHNPSVVEYRLRRNPDWQKHER
ncbi:MAG: hypothetical protein M1816_007340 [Peltula sp. TS41687]|nr:MAG: hypothetical protein M1816_007340 [Peltula sp. TS41687]